MIRKISGGGFAQFLRAIAPLAPENRADRGPRCADGGGCAEFR